MWEAAATQLKMTYIGRRQEDMEQWVELREGEKGYYGGGHRRGPNMRQYRSNFGQPCQGSHVKQRRGGYSERYSFSGSQKKVGIQRGKS